jgi:hypothetical protein
MQSIESQTVFGRNLSPPSCLVYRFTLKMEATGSSKTPVDFQWTTKHYISEDRTLHNHHCENLVSYVEYYNSSFPERNSP